MKGTNELRLNSATMMEAIQEWLDRRWNSEAGGPSPEVYAIRSESTHGVNTFFVGLKDTDDE